MTAQVSHAASITGFKVKKKTNEKGRNHSFLSAVVSPMVASEMLLTVPVVSLSSSLTEQTRAFIWRYAPLTHHLTNKRVRTNSRYLQPEQV